VLSLSRTNQVLEARDVGLEGLLSVSVRDDIESFRGKHPGRVLDIIFTSNR